MNERGRGVGLVKVNGCAGCADLIEKVISLVVHHYERREILDFDLPHCFHAKFFILQNFNFGDAVLSETSCRSTYRT
jgi:hypothetical protein